MAKGKKTAKVTKKETTEQKVNQVETKAPIKKKGTEIGKVNGVPVYQQSAFIRTESYATPIPMYRLPVELQKYLRNKGFGTNVYLESKEWLEKHGADMEMIEKLKQFISGNFN